MKLHEVDLKLTKYRPCKQIWPKKTIFDQNILARKELLEPEEKIESTFSETKPEEIPEFMKIKLKKNVASF